MKKVIASLFAIFCLMAPVFAAGSKDSGHYVTISGKQISLPKKIERIISLSPSNTEILDGLGVSKKIIAVDTYSRIPEGVSTDIPKFDIMNPNTEQLIALAPDVILTTGMAEVKGTDPYQPCRNAGITVISIPTASTIDEIIESITMLGTITKTTSNATKLNKKITTAISNIKSVVARISEAERKTVYFEVSPAPYLYTTGYGTYAHEMFEICGLTNVFGDIGAWKPVSNEQVLAKNPDFIFTTTDFLPDPIQEIASRKGWAVIAAVKNNSIYQIENRVISQPCQNIIEGLEYISKTVYPKYFK